MALNKKNVIVLIEYIAELLMLFALYTLSEIDHISFGRYAFLFSMLYIILRNKGHNSLIWQEAKYALLFYSCLFVVTLTIQPMKTISIKLLTNNFMICFGNFVFAMVFKRSFHALFFEQLSDKVMIIGTGHHAAKLSNVCRYNRFALAKAVCYVRCNDDRFEIAQEEVAYDHPIYDFKDLDKCIKENNIDVAIIAKPQATKSDMSIITDSLRDKVKTIKFLPQVNGMFTYESKIEDYDGLLMISNHEAHTSVIEKIIKRIIDICAGICGCIIFVPLYFVIKVLNFKNDDRDPVIFTQDRIGLNGKRIKIYKFRSMIPHAEEVLEKLMAEDPDIRHEYLTNKKLENDPRITPVGKFIRKTSLDEWPQFINVLKGDMSIVGPRPYLFREKDDMGIYYNAIIKAKPGITGMWQVSGRSDTTFKERCSLDEYYCKNWSIWLDFVILVKTVKALITKEGAK